MTTTDKAVLATVLPFTILAGIILGRFLFVAACLVLYRARRRREAVS
ncbi:MULTISPECIES: hypothetical protein [Rhodococcus]|nr:hypothetical protein [Rhodococcus pyridinivorans]MCD2116776.1 hypothetical protein [Rhodococcus pyridinivorans]MCZ4626016.1 hypothetical protein [Rhodococcus pyridinivorans]MCZ4646971.1 hypothetical protein [Rhodococcus pyridinivorans]MDJ0480323.1 hypothetical protein [Rhodococcus pyridinivorans]MDV7253074.1 hypothetical protein [Rhodococcus pyridinivorans]